MTKEFRKTIYSPMNSEKYVGRTPIIARSSWEFKFMRFLDLTPSVKEWSSESIAIAYLNPLTGRPTRYFPDFLVKFVDSSGKEVIEVIEVKPYKQTIPPIASKGKRKTTLLQEAKTWAVNSAKWRAAREYCEIRGFTFRILTERELKV